MSKVDLITLALAKKYTDKSMEGGGAVAGKNCTVSSITPITGGNRVTFLWTLDDGTEQTDTMDVMDGQDGNDGNGIASVEKTGTSGLVDTYTITFTNGDTTTFTVTNGVDGEDGEGIPTGGTAGQVLVKKSSEDYDTEWNTPAGGGDMLKSVYDTDNDGKVDSAENADTVAGHTVAKDVPADAKFTDTVYDDTEIRGDIADKVDKVDGKGLSTEDYTSEEKTKLAGVEASAEVNTIESITLNGTEVTPDANKNVALTVITKAVNDLVNYYLKSETYSKTEVDDIVTAIKNSRFEVVAALPTTDIKTNVIYLVPKSPSQTSNVKDEYINLDGTTAGWEKIGDTEIDLSNYVTTQALNTALAAYTTTADLTTLLAAKQDTLTFDNAPTENSNNPVKSGGVYSADANICAEMTRQGVKNILSQQFDEVMITASLGNKATSANGLTLTYNSDGSIKINGTPTDSAKNVAIRFDWDTNNHPFDISYLAGKKIVASISETETNGIKIIPGYFDASDGAHQYSGADITTKGEYTYPNDTKWARCYLSISGAYSYSNVTVYPMIYIPFEGATDDYVPYAKTNQQLTEDTTVLLDNTEVNGAVNILPYPYSDSNKVDRGVTFIDNGDGTVSVNGTASQDIVAAFYFTQPKSSYLPAGTYKLTVEGRVGTSASSSSPDWYYIYNQTTGQDLASPSRPIFTYNGIDTLFFRYTVAKGQTVSTTLKPMITVVSYNGDYVPYAKSNKELTTDAEALTNQANDMVNVLGAKNLIPNNASSQITNGVTFTVNSDGTVTVSGTATGTATLYLTSSIDLSLFNGMLLNGCPVPSSDDAILRLEMNESPWTGISQNVSDAEIDGFASGTLGKLFIRVFSGKTVNVTFKPMIRLASITDDTYEPYAKTNQELTDDTASAIANITNGAVNLAKPKLAGTTTVSDVEFVVDSEGKVTANGTASANIRFDMAEVTLKAGRTYKICEPSSLQARRPLNPETYRCYARIKSSGVWVLQNNGWKGSYTPTEDVVVSVGIAMQSGNQVTDEIFAPMLVLDGTDVGDTFYPYAMTNRELTKVNVAEVNVSIQTTELAQYRVRKWGKVVECTISLQVNEAVTAWTDFATVPEGFRPSTYIQAVNNKTIYTGFAVVQIAPNGGIQSSVNLAVGDRVRFTAVWICP